MEEGPLKQLLSWIFWRPRQDSNLRSRLRRPVLYPLSYEGWWACHPFAGSRLPRSSGAAEQPRHSSSGGATSHL